MFSVLNSFGKRKPINVNFTELPTVLTPAWAVVRRSPNFKSFEDVVNSVNIKPTADYQSLFC
uniref:Uncharacterized protein n=1 Tax=Glossina brevipalpis TaxID=37001 RepID=A0A1A9X568_9MUSC